MVPLPTNPEGRRCDVALSAVLVLLLSPPSFPPGFGWPTCTNNHTETGFKFGYSGENLRLCPERYSHTSCSTFLPNWSRLPPTSSEEVQPIPGLQSRAEGGKEVAGNRDGDRRGCWRAWRTGRTGDPVWLRLFQPRLHVSKQTPNGWSEVLS